MTKINFIAELCQNHLGKIKNVEKMLDECATNGAKIIKLQYIYAKNLSYRARFENGISEKKKIYSIKRPVVKVCYLINNQFPIIIISIVMRSLL